MTDTISSKPSVLVIGAGIVGAMIAYRLSYEGHCVQVIEQAEPGAGVTARSSGWVNWITRTPSDDPQGYARLQNAFDHYAALDEALGGTLIGERAGALRWCAEQGQTETMIAAHEAAGSPIETVNGVRLRKLAPLLADPPPLAAYSRHDFLLNARSATLRLLDEAKAHGARVHTHAQAIAINSKGTRAHSVTVDDETLSADAIILAAGTATNALLAPFGVGEIIQTSPAALIRLQVRDVPPGPILYGPKLEVHPHPPTTITMARGVPAGANDEAGTAAMLGEDSLRRLREAMPGLGNVRLISSSIGKRPIPTHGSPLVEKVAGLENLIVAVGHPGVILAPLMADHVTVILAS